jgi:hypothetical protein
MASFEEALQEFRDNAMVQRYVNELSADGEAAIKLAAKLATSATARACSGVQVGAMKDSAAEVKDAVHDLEEQYAELLDGEPTSFGPFEDANNHLVEALEELEERVGRFQAVEDSGLAAALVALAARILVLMAGAARLKKLSARIVQIEKDLKSLQKKVVAADAKTALGAAVTAVGVATGPVGALTVVLTAVAVLAADKIIDKAITGEASVDMKDAVGGALSAVDLTKEATTASGKLAKGSAPFIALAITATESATTRSALTAAKKELTDILKEAKSIESDVFAAILKAEPVVKAAEKAFDAALKAANSYRAPSRTAPRY